MENRCVYYCSSLVNTYLEKQGKYQHDMSHERNVFIVWTGKHAAMTKCGRGDREIAETNDHIVTIGVVMLDVRQEDVAEPSMRSLILKRPLLKVCLILACLALRRSLLKMLPPILF